MNKTIYKLQNYEIYYYCKPRITQSYKQNYVTKLSTIYVGAFYTVYLTNFSYGDIRLLDQSLLIVG